MLHIWYQYWELKIYLQILLYKICSILVAMEMTANLDFTTCYTALIFKKLLLVRQSAI